MRNRGRKDLLLAKAIPRHPGIQSSACLLPGKLGSKSMSYLHKRNKAAKQEHINLKGKIAQHLMYFNKRTYWIYFGDNQFAQFSPIASESLSAIISTAICSIVNP